MTLLKTIFILLFTVSAHASEVVGGSRGPRQQPQATPPPKAVKGPPHDAQIMRMCTPNLSFAAAEDVGEGKKEPAVMSGKDTCEMALSPTFAQAMQSLIPRCAQMAAVKAGMARPTRVKVFQMGGFNVRATNTPSGKGDSWSRHSTGQALDIHGLGLEYDDPSQCAYASCPSQARFTKDITPLEQAFYNAFRECWNKQGDYMRGGKSCACSICADHMDRPSNALHNDHMHMSYSCPSQAGVAGC